MTAASISKKILKTIAIVLGFLLGILLSFHFWFISHAEDLISELVTEQSKGKLKLEMKKFSFNWLKKRMELHKAVFYTTDSTDPNGYRIEVDRLQLKLKELYPVIAEKKFLIDSLKLINPVITVTRLRAPHNNTTDTSSENLSIPQEMGRVYNSIRDALKVLEVDRFQIDNGTFSMVNKADPSANEQPVTISRIHFYLDNLRVDSSQHNSQQKILFSDNVALQTTRQDIFFPDGRHRLSFSNFRINLEHRLAEFDSCTITASKGDSSNSSFTVFFDKLKMTNIDFDTLYHAEVIKADSVYCINPRFTLNVKLKDDALSKAPKLDELVQQLTGDLQLKFVIVENGSFDINTMRKGRPSSFVSHHNNFEMQGLRIKKDAPRPLTVNRFAMAIRNYENFLRDSAFSIKFDSILLYNNRISLGNFAYKEYINGNTSSNVTMPQFELYGLSWDDLIFDRRLKAEQVVLYKPVINYNLDHKKNDAPQDVFKALQEVNKILQLRNLNIINGQVNLLFRNNAKLTLENVTSFVTAQQVLKAYSIAGIQGSVNMLMFKKGRFTMNGLNAEITDAVLSSSGNQLQAGSVMIKKKDRLSIHAKNIRMLSLLIDQKAKRLIAGGVHWKDASIDITSPQTKDAGKNPGGELIIKDIRGSNTSLVLHAPANELSLFLESLNIKEFSTGEKKWRANGFSATGRDFIRKDKHSLLTIKRFDLEDDQPSSLEDIHYTSKGIHDSARIQIPLVKLVAQLSSLAHGQFRIRSLNIKNPTIAVHALKSSDDEGEDTARWPFISIEKLHIEHPDVYFSQQEEKGTTWIEWKGDRNNFLELEQVTTDSAEGPGFRTAKLAFFLDHLLFHTGKGKTFNTRDGQLSALIENMAFRKNEAGAWDWKGKITNLFANNFVLDSVDKSGGRLVINTAKLQDLLISSPLLLNLYELVKQNTKFTLKEISGNYQNNKNRFSWNNLSFDKYTHDLSLDSFSYHPMLTQEEFVKTHPYQADYAIINTGPVQLRGVSMERFLKDTILDLRSVRVTNASLDDFRDQRVPRQPGIVRPLPVAHLKKFPVKLSIDSLELKNTFVRYGEFNDKTEAAGWINVNRVNAVITNIRNYDATAHDSLAMHATAYLEDSLFTALQLKGSYTDTLGGFLMQVQMAPADLRVLNPAIGPLAGATLKSGYLDTMSMQVTGRDYMAYGEMTMVYHDLKVMLTGKPDQKKKFWRGVLNSVVNAVLKGKNTDKKGTVYFVRLKDRSAMNYLVKITLSGVGSSVGLGKNKRQLKRYMRKNNKLP